MDETPASAEGQQLGNVMLHLSVDVSETALQLKQRVLTQFLAAPSTSAPSAQVDIEALYYRGSLLRDAELLVQQVQDTGEVHLIAVLADHSRPSHNSSSQPSSSASNPASSPRAAGSLSASSSSSSLPSASNSSRRSAPPPEQVLADLNRLITADILSPLLDMGFTRPRAIKALITNLLNAELAIAWLLEHTDDADIDDPLTPQQLHAIARAFHLIPSPDIDQCIRAGRCTYTVTAERYAAQQYYQCRTCELVGGRGCCVSCARVCHAGHVVEGPIPSESFFCDCGAGVGGVGCRALTGGSAPGNASEAGVGGDGASGGAEADDEDGMDVGEEEARRIKAEEEMQRRFEVRPNPTANLTASINELNPLDFLTALAPHMAYPPLPRAPLVAHGSLATAHSLLLQRSDWPAAQRWVGAHTEELLQAFERHLLGGGGGGGEAAAGLVAMLCWVVEWLPLWQQSVLDSIARLLGGASSVGWQWHLPLLVNVFASPHARPLIAQLPIAELQPADNDSSISITETSTVTHSTTPRALYAKLLFNVALHCSHPAQPLPPPLLPALLALLSSPGSDATGPSERQAVHLCAVHALLLCTVPRGRDVRVGCLALGLSTGLEPIVARKDETASAFAALLLRVVRL